MWASELQMRPPESLSVLFQYCWEAWEAFVLPGWLRNFQEKKAEERLN